MQGVPKYVEDNIELKAERERKYAIHQQRIQQILRRDDGSSKAQIVSSQMDYKKALKQQNKTFNQNEKNILLNRENQILLNKLVDISNGKWSSVGGQNTRVKKKRTSESQGPRSLNISIRKRENERIERENHAFAKRLYENQGIISKKKFDHDYVQNLQHKQRIQRVKKVLPGIGGKATALPPLELSAFKKTKRSYVSQNRTTKSGLDSGKGQRFKSSSPDRPYATSGSQVFSQGERQNISVNRESRDQGSEKIVDKVGLINDPSAAIETEKQTDDRNSVSSKQNQDRQEETIDKQAASDQIQAEEASAKIDQITQPSAEDKSPANEVQVSASKSSRKSPMSHSSKQKSPLSHSFKQNSMTRKGSQKSKSAKSSQIINSEVALQNQSEEKVQLDQKAEIVSNQVATEPPAELEAEKNSTDKQELPAHESQGGRTSAQESEQPVHSPVKFENNPKSSEKSDNK